MEKKEEELKLIGAWYSPFVYRVKWALRLKWIQHEYIEQEVAHNNKGPLLIQFNPIHKKVPVLIHNGKPICESLVIIEYLDETWKENPLLPRDPNERAVARFWAKFVEEKLSEVTRNVLTQWGELQENATKQAKEALEILEGEIKGKKFFGGERIGLVDIVLGYMSYWLDPIEEASCVKIFDRAQYPCLAQWMENFLELPLIKESNLPDRGDLVLHFTNIRNYVLSLSAQK